ncbi:LytR/AlgR family response regulator transcription factor [Sphingomonas sp. LT1P40]|uniref:LytR/AlgR family response regulator transcription factor n=1 Tax=Alteristakelama amylovorans TaxID=3096166 RepID=UPI002FCA511B
MLRAILIDDEALAIRRLALALKPFTDVEVVATGASARHARLLIAEHRPDLVFLDIAMPGTSGLDIAGEIAGSGPAVIFVTAFDSHGAAAFGVDAVDYLLKPVAPERLAAAIARARTWIGGRAKLTADATPPDDSIWAYRHREYVRIRIADISWAEADGDYVRLHTADGTGLVRATLSAIEARLIPAGFIRVHRSALCRREAIAGLLRRPSGALAIRLNTGAEIPAGRSYVGGLRGMIDRLQDPAP